MKTARWVCRYIFLGLAMTAAAAWCGVCWSAVREVRSEVMSTTFIDLAMKSIPEATEQLLRLERLRTLLKGGIFAAVAVLLLLALLIAFHILSKRVPGGVKARMAPGRKTGKKTAAVAGSVPAPAAAGALFCQACGARLEGTPRFCPRCGSKLG